MGQYTGELIHYLIRDIADVGKYFFAGIAAFFAAGLTISLLTKVRGQNEGQRRRFLGAAVLRDICVCFCSSHFCQENRAAGSGSTGCLSVPLAAGRAGMLSCPGKCPAVCSVWCIAARGLRENEAGLEYIMYGMCSQSVH